jgi:hypothetical protein
VQRADILVASINIAGCTGSRDLGRAIPRFNLAEQRNGIIQKRVALVAQ